jgi:hypothetical protein
MKMVLEKGGISIEEKAASTPSVAANNPRKTSARVSDDAHGEKKC